MVQAPPHEKYVRVYRQTIHDVDAYIVLCDAYRRQIINTLNLPAESVEASKVTAIENSCQLPQAVNTDKEKRWSTLDVWNLLTSVLTA